MNIMSLLPQFFWLGPPFPQFMGIYWPWSQPAVPTRGSISTEYLPKPKPRAESPVLYQNTEELEVIRGSDGRIEKVVRHIKVTKEA